MNIIKKLVSGAAFIIALFAFQSTYAQGGGGRGDTAAMRQRMEAMMQKMKTDLKLTDAQSDSLTAINKDFQPKMREIRQDQSASQDDRRAKMMELNDARNKRIQAALGDDLYKKYQQWMQDNMPRGGGRMGGGRGGNGGGGFGGGGNGGGGGQ